MIKILSDFSTFTPVPSLAGLDGSTFAQVFGRTHKFIMSDGNISPDNGVYWVFSSALAYKLGTNNFSVTGNFQTADTTTCDAALRLYGLGTGNNMPKQGIYQIGVRLKRTGTIPSAPPIHFKALGDSAYKKGASTASPDVYIEVVLDYVNSKATVYYDGAEVWVNSVGQEPDKLVEFFIGSYWEPTSPSPFMSGGGTVMTFSDFYLANYPTKPSTGYPIFGSIDIKSSSFSSSDSALTSALGATYNSTAAQAPTGYAIPSQGAALSQTGLSSVTGDVLAVSAVFSASKTASSPASSLHVEIKDGGVVKAESVSPALLNPEATFPVRAQPQTVYCNDTGKPLSITDLNAITVDISPVSPRG